MNETITPTHQYLLNHFGPLLTLEHLAEVLHSSPGGVRMAMARKREPISEALAEARRKMGRRLFFEASRVAEIIDRNPAGLAGNPSSPE